MIGEVSGLGLMEGVGDHQEGSRAPNNPGGVKGWRLPSARERMYRRVCRNSS
jgi:hypothetical protein